MDTLCVIAQYFDVTIDYLIYGINENVAIDMVLGRLDNVKRVKIINLIKCIREIVEE